VSVENRRLSIWNADIGSDYAVMDMQGKTVRAGTVNHSGFEMTIPYAGQYIVKVGKSLRRISVR